MRPSLRHSRAPLAGARRIRAGPAGPPALPSWDGALKLGRLDCVVAIEGGDGRAGVN